MKRLICKYLDMPSVIIGVSTDETSDEGKGDALPAYLMYIFFMYILDRSYECASVQL